MYLADVCARSGVVIDPDWNDEFQMGQCWDLRVSLGRLAHAVLKHHQGIRGFDNPTKFQNAVEESALQVFYGVNEQFNADRELSDDYDLAERFTATWTQVKHRDWKKNPANAHEVADGS